MKNLIIFGIFIIFLVCAQFAQAQTVDEVINKHIAALGGKQNLNKIQNLVMEGTLSVQGIEVALTITQVNNKLNRQDFTAMGMHGFDMMTDKEGWQYFPFQGMKTPEAKPAGEVKKNQADLDISGSLVDYAAKGNKLELIGKEDVEGVKCYKIKATLAGGKEATYFIDVTTSMIVRTKEITKVNGQDTELQVDFSNYKDVEGVKMPFSITQQAGTITISSIKANQTISESAYKHDI